MHYPADLQIQKDYSKRAPARLKFAELLLASAISLSGAPAAKQQQSVDEWRALSSNPDLRARAFVKGDTIRFFFATETAVVGFSARWSRVRVPVQGYRVNSAILRLDKNLTMVQAARSGWREAVVITPTEWRRMATSLIAALTPDTPGHGAYYRGFLTDRVFYRDAGGAPQFASLGQQPANVVIDRRWSIDETLASVARLLESQLAASHPGESLFLLMAPDGQRLPQPLLLDRKKQECVWLAPAALFDRLERGARLSGTLQGVTSLLLESHGLALLKNPVSSAARLADLGLQTLVRFIRLPLPKGRKDVSPVATCKGMDLNEWEAWLDRYTGTHREPGSLDLLIDGDRFYPRLQKAIAAATNHIHMNVYMFDRDDVAIDMADQLKQRSAQVEVKVLLDRMGSIAAGMLPPGTPIPENFVPPVSITSYLKENSNVKVHTFLNPWFSSDHSKVFLVDGAQAWLGGMNLGREYRYEWHDVMVELSGPVVASLEEDFRRDWAHAATLGDLAYVASLLKPSASALRAALTNSIPVRLLPTRTGWKPFNAAVLKALRSARNYIYVENPYLFDKRVIKSLVQARARGVDVRVILPRVNDFKAGGRSNLIVANYLLQEGIRVYFFPGMTHVKALLVDGWSCVGSANLNHLSMRVCQEQNVATSDPAFATRLNHDLFQEDFSRSYELTEPIAVEWVDFMADLVLEGF